MTLRLPGHRFRNARPLRSMIRRMSSPVLRARFPVLVAICCLTLLLLGALQLSWIDQISDSRRREALESLDRSIRAFTRHVVADTYGLLTVFKADTRPSPQRPDRLPDYLERLWVWQDLFKHGPAVKRVLFYDFKGSRSGDLTQLALETGIIRPTTWGAEMAGVQRNITEAGFRNGRIINSRWLHTWLFDPGAMAIWRPMVKFNANPRTGRPNYEVTGYFIVQLDLTFIRNDLMPELLEGHFIGPSGIASYEVSLTLNDRPLGTYHPSVEGDSQNEGISSYSLVASAGRGEPPRQSPPERAFRLLLRSNDAPAAVRRRGGIQRVGLQAPGSGTARGGLEPHVSHRDTRASTISTREIGAENAGRLQARLAASTETPRLFIVSDMPHKLELIARHVGASLEDTLNSEYRRAVTIGSGLLLLVGVVLAVIAISANLVVRQAALQTEAVANVSHEFRTPLAVIGVIGHNLAQGMLGSGKKEIEYGRLLVEHGGRLGQMVDQTLHLSAIESGDETYSVADVDVGKVTEEALADIGPMIEEAGIEVECTKAGGLPPARADEEALRRSLGNLLSNAVKYGQPGCWLKLETREAGDGPSREVQIRVHDRGPGIAATERSKVFDPYYRVANDRTSRIPGSGLGLKLSRDMIKGMGGALTLESEPGHGSVFTIHLPVAA